MHICMHIFGELKNWYEHFALMKDLVAHFGLMKESVRTFWINERTGKHILD